MAGRGVCPRRGDLARGISPGLHREGANAACRAKRIEFVNDGVAWSGWESQAGAAGYAKFDWQLGRWYQFEMKIEDGMLIGKVTEIGRAVPRKSRS